MAQHILTVERLRELITYDPLTGILNWQPNHGWYREGKVLGYLRKDGYLKTHVLRASYLSHRLAWFHVNGVWPSGEIDHINGNRADNRIANLRDVSRTTNLQNRRTAMARSKSGILGVSKAGNRWEAMITLAGKVHRLGIFDQPEAAYDAYVTAKRQMHVGCTL